MMADPGDGWGWSEISCEQENELKMRCVCEFDKPPVVKLRGL